MIVGKKNSVPRFRKPLLRVLASGSDKVARIRGRGLFDVPQEIKDAASSVQETALTIQEELRKLSSSITEALRKVDKSLYTIEQASLNFDSLFRVWKGVGYLAILLLILLILRIAPNTRLPFL